VAVAAGLVGGPGVAAGGAHVEMPAEQGGAAGRDGALVEGERVLASIGGPVGADDIGDVEGRTGRRRATRAAHRGGHRGLRPGRGSLPEAVEAIEGTLHAAQHRARHEGVARRAAERAVAEEVLERTHGGAGLEQVGRAAVAQGVRGDVLGAAAAPGHLRSMCQTALREIGCPGLVPWKR